MANSLSSDGLISVDASCRASNHLPVGEIHPNENPFPIIHQR
ncbi:hypothetical protein LMIY3S_00612 [Labrys miyagiensis]